MLKLTALTFALLAALSFGATTAQAGHLGRGVRAIPPTGVSSVYCPANQRWDGEQCELTFSAGSSQTKSTPNNCNGTGNGNHQVMNGSGGICLQPLNRCCHI